MNEKSSEDTPKRTTTSQSNLPDSPFVGGILQSPSKIPSTPRSSPIKGQSLVALHAQAQAKYKAKVKQKEGHNAATTTTWTSRHFVSSPQEQASTPLEFTSPARKLITPSDSMNKTTPRRKTLVERAGEFPPKKASSPPPQSPSISGAQRLILSGMALASGNKLRGDCNEVVDALRQKHKDEMQCMQKRQQEELAALLRQYSAD